METINRKTSAKSKDVLINEIAKHNQLYRQGTPDISDAEYDAMVDVLRELDPENEWFKHKEPVTVSENRKVKLPIQMKSLNKVKNLPEISNWLRSLSVSQNTQIVITPKFDGLSLLYGEYSHKAYSRGGTDNEGQDCTEHYKMLGVPRHGKIGQYTFGEFVFSRSKWETHFAGKISPETGEKYKSPRNTAAGLLNRDNASELIKYVDFYRYGIDTSATYEFATYEKLLNTLCHVFNQDKLYSVVSAATITEELLMALFKEWSNIYYIDGLVLYINDINLWKTIGRHQSTGNPLYAIAYKHPDFTDAFPTTVKNITWKVNKAGALKPVVNIEVVDTGDCNMENPTGYNAGWINDHGIAQGAKILVTRSGGVIPKIISTIIPATRESQEELWDDLCECPHCGSPTRWNENGIELCCTNKQCDGVRLAKMVFFYLTCGAENVGEETLSKIYNAGFKSIKSLLNITFDDLMTIEGFGESISNTIIENNRKIMNGVDIFTLMHASDCFTGIGKVKAQKILDDMEPECREMFYNLEYPYLTPANPEYDTLSKTMQAFENGVLPFMHFVKETGVPITMPTKTEVNHDGKCAGMNVCFSGIRDSELEKVIISQGGMIASGVSKKTTHLVVKDPNGNSSKISKAKDIGIAILSISQFKDIL